MRTDFETVRRIELAARRQRAEAIARLAAAAFAWVLSPRIALPSWRAHVQGRASQG